MSETIFNLLLNIFILILGFIFALFLEKIKKPVLVIEKGEIGFMGPNDPLKRREAAFPYILVKNKRLPLFWGYFLKREPAYACKAYISFLDLDFNILFEKEMFGRWTSNPQPYVQKVIIDNTPYFQLKVIQDSFDIHPDETASLNTIVKIKDDEMCYGWSDESYLNGWENPNWKINKKKFLIKIRLRTGGQEFVKLIGIENRHNFKKVKFFSVSD